MHENSHSYATYIPDDKHGHPLREFQPLDFLTANSITQTVVPTPATVAYRKRNGQLVEGQRGRNDRRVMGGGGGDIQTIEAEGFAPPEAPKYPPGRKMHKFRRNDAPTWRRVPGLAEPVVGVEFCCHRSRECPARLFVFFGRPTQPVKSRHTQLHSRGSCASTPISLDDDDDDDDADDLMDCSIQEYADDCPIPFDPVLKQCLSSPPSPPCVHVVPLRRYHVCLSDYTVRYEKDSLVLPRIAWAVHRGPKPLPSHHHDHRRILLQTLTDEVVIGQERPQTVAHVYTLDEVVGLKRIDGKTYNNVKVWRCCDATCCIAETHIGSPVRHCPGEVWQYGEVVRPVEERDWVRQRFYSPRNEKAHFQHTFVALGVREEVVDGPPIDVFTLYQSFGSLATPLLTALTGSSNSFFRHPQRHTRPRPTYLPPPPPDLFPPLPPFQGPLPAIAAPRPPPPAPPPPPAVSSLPLPQPMRLFQRYAPGGSDVPPMVTRIPTPPPPPAPLVNVGSGIELIDIYFEGEEEEEEERRNTLSLPPPPPPPTLGGVKRRTTRSQTRERWERERRSG